MLISCFHSVDSASPFTRRISTGFRSESSHSILSSITLFKTRLPCYSFLIALVALLVEGVFHLSRSTLFLIGLQKVNALYPQEPEEPTRDNDIGDMKSLLKNHRCWARLIDSIDDPIFVKDEKHRWVYVNDAACQFWGHSREDLRGKTDYDIFPMEEADVY